MNVRLTRGEYWILDHAVEYANSLSGLAAPDLAEMENKPTHGLTVPQLVDTLTGLFEQGWIETLDSDPDGIVVTQQLSRSEIEGIFTPGARKPWWYQLTSAGGAVWESFAAPNWDKYIAILWPDPEEGGELLGGSRRCMAEYLALVHHGGHFIIPGSERWDEVQPWQATYWKQLPVGHRVQFDFTRDMDRAASEWHKVPHRYVLLGEWWCRWR